MYCTCVCWNESAVGDVCLGTYLAWGWSHEAKETNKQTNKER